MHKNSLEFELAERILNAANGENIMEKAISYYEMACAKNDARAYLALYKIKISKCSSHSILGPQDVEDVLRFFEDDEGIPFGEKNDKDDYYLLRALELGYLPAFLYAGTLYESYSVYLRLVFLSIGLGLSYERKDDLYSDFQKSFLELSEKFANEFIPEILQIGQEWKIGDALEIGESKLHGKLISNPNSYDSERDLNRLNWKIFPTEHNIEKYLRQLPGSDDYYFAVKAEDEDSSIYIEKMLAAAKKGNGQAIYALLQDGLISSTRCKAAENGSPDAFEDLIDSISEISIDADFFNTSRSILTDKRTLAQIDCLVYLYTIMERLGISHWEHGCIKAIKLSCESDSGYVVDLAYSDQLKYQLCDHEHVAMINDRAYAWSLGKSFDNKFFELLKILDLDS